MPYYEYFTGKGGQIFLEHKVLDVYVNDQGAVIGAKVQKPDGSIMNVKANKGVVLAGGSWKANPELRRLTDPRFTENMISTGYPFVAPDGSAILAGMRAGGMYVGDRCEDTPHLRRKFGTAHYGFPKGSKYGAPGLGISGPRWAEVIFTNKSGDRFVKELDKANLGGYTSTTQRLHSLSSSCGRCSMTQPLKNTIGTRRPQLVKRVMPLQLRRLPNWLS